MKETIIKRAIKVETMIKRYELWANIPKATPLLKIRVIWKILRMIGKDSPGFTNLTIIVLVIWSKIKIKRESKKIIFSLLLSGRKYRNEHRVRRLNGFY